MVNSIVMAQSSELNKRHLGKPYKNDCNSLQLFPIPMYWSIFQLNLRHRWTSKSCPPSFIPWHKVCKPPQGVVHRKLNPPDGGHLGCGIWQRHPRFPPSPVTLCLHLHYSADPPHPKKNLWASAEEREYTHLKEQTLQTKGKIMRWRHRIGFISRSGALTTKHCM